MCCIRAAGFQYLLGYLASTQPINYSWPSPKISSSYEGAEFARNGLCKVNVLPTDGLFCVYQFRWQQYLAYYRSTCIYHARVIVFCFKHLT